MAFSAIPTRCSFSLPPAQYPPSSSLPRYSVSFRFSQLKLNGRKPFSIRAASVSGTLFFSNFIYKFYNDLFFISFLFLLCLLNLKEYVIVYHLF